LWENVFIEWERCNILDKSGGVFACPSKPIGKSTFGCLTNLKEKQLEKFARGLFDHIINL
jgi:hypothetical protein